MKNPIAEAIAAQFDDDVVNLRYGLTSTSQLIGVHQMAEENGKKKTSRAKRRNYANEIERLTQYCEIKRDVLRSIDGSGQDPLWKSAIDAYEDILSRLKAS